MSPELEASPTPKLLGMQELSLHTASILSPLFLVLKRIDPPGHSPLQTMRRPITADRILTTAFESTSTGNSITFISLPSQCTRHTPARTCFTSSCAFLILSAH